MAPPEPSKKGAKKKVWIDTSGEVLTTSEAAALLRVDARTLRRLVEAGEIPMRRAGRNFRFSRAALLEWLAKGDTEN